MKKLILATAALLISVMSAAADNRHISSPEDSLALPTSRTDWIDPVTATPVNTDYRLYPSPHRAEDSQASCMVYIPDCYYTDSITHYPVIYYLHGGTGNQREARWMINRIDTAIREGRMDPVLVVAPQALPIGWYINANTSDPKVTSGPIEDLIILDLIPFIDENYRTIAAREGRGIEGFSMGGRGAMMLGLKHPDIFGAISSVAGALVNWDEEPLQRALECTFGDISDPLSKTYFDAWHPKVFACTNARRIIESGMKIRMFVGDRDRLYEENGIRITDRFHNLLERLGIDHSFTVAPGAGHNPAEIFAEGVLVYDTTFWDDAFSSARN